MTQPPTVPGLAAGDRARLVDVLTLARSYGFLGPGPIDEQLERSCALGPIVASASAAVGPTPLALDLGSGGGLPGLVLSMLWPTWRWHLLDGSERRCAWLRDAVGLLDIGERVAVVEGRAEEVARTALRHQVDLVVARGFAAPAPTAECAAGLLRTGGRFVVTEPPGGAPDRWSVEGLRTLGMRLGESVADPVAAQVIEQTALCDDRYPRRTGVPVKRPLWES